MPSAEQLAVLAAENADEECGADPRVQLLGAYVAQSLRPAVGAWERCAGSAEAERLLQAFLGGSAAAEPQPLLVVQPGPGGLAVRPGLDATPECRPARAKGLFFLRTGPEPLGPHSLRGAVLCGDVPAAPLEHLATMFSEVILPVLTNEKNHLGWPHVVCQDVRQHAHNLQCNLWVILEQVKGKTLLPLPVGSEKMEFVDSETVLDSIDKSVIYSIESAVIRWSHQVQVVLKRESSLPLLQGENPMPKVELEFWKNRYEDLEYIYSQLKTIKVRGMAGLLDRLRSSYFPAFKAMFRDIITALTEAQDIHAHLMPLRRHLETIESVEFQEVKPQLRPLLHMVCLIWATCQHYRSPGRLTVLLQEICNLLIQQASTYLSPEDLLRSEVEESQRKLQVVVDTLSFFKQIFKNRRENLHTYFKQDQEVKEWDFPSSLVFVRLDCFLGRLHMVEDLLKTTLDFQKLGKLEFSGIRGNALSWQAQRMYDEFQDMCKVFSESSYDCLDLQSMEFEDDISEFNQRVEDLDRRLGTVFIQAFDDASGLDHAFKLLSIAGNLLERPLVAQDVSDKYAVLIRMFSQDLDAVRLIYNQHVQEEAELGFSQVHKNMPAVAGGLRWVQELRQRIQGPISNFQSLSHPCMESVEGKRMVQKYEDMLSSLEKYETRLYENWCQTVSEKSQYNLSRPLLKRDPETKQITVNFNPQLTSVLKEMSYLEPRQMKHIPETAAAMFSSREFYRQLVANLELMANWYNKVVRTLLEVEFPLVEGELHGIDCRLRAAEETLNWKTEGIWDYVVQVTNSIHDLEQRIQKTKDNVEKIQNIMKTWVSPIFKRKDGKKECLLSLDDQHEHMERYYNLIKESGHKIHALVQENLTLFSADPTSQIWKTYVNYIDDMLLDGFFLAIECSLKYLMENTENKPGVTPIFETQLSLAIPELVFYPSLDPTVKGGFYDIFEGLLTSIFGISSLVPRLSPQNHPPHYQVDMEAKAELASLRDLLMERVWAMTALCSSYRGTFSQYSYLYGEDRKEVLGQFLSYGHVLTADEIEAHAEDGIPENPPLLHHFKVQIDLYESLCEEVCKLEPTRVFDSWMKIDVRPFKASLLNVIKRWSLMFKQHLVDYVTNSLADLEVFIKTSESGLLMKVEKGDFKGLVEITGHLMALKERQSTTDEMFEPLKQTIELLKTYEQELPDTVYKQLEELPEKWNNIKKMAVTVRQQVAPLQASEVTVLRQRCTAFEVEQQRFWEQFRKEAPFRFDSVDPHQMLDTKHVEIQQMESTMASLSESAGLFEVNVPDYKQLRQCRKEACQLKELWDTIGMVTSSIHAWETTKWRDINVEAMELECKRFARHIRNLDKEVRAWDAFTGLESTVLNTLTSLRAVAELQNPAIRERHWRQLMQATGVSFTMDEDTTLAHLLQLQLHHFEDEVRGIVDRAVKEMGMEKTLKELQTTWAGMEFQYEAHPRTCIPLWRSDEDLIEILEDNQVQLQNLMMSKYIAFFLEEVSGWQKKLSTADAVISIWFEVQRTWSHLESIFIGSEDIRAQLPQDSKRFEGIDVDFKELAYEAQKTPNVVEATNKSGLYEKLEDIQSRLCLCEKALAEYLDTKRLAFPRFYFLSSSDLLDILSNGTAPLQVQRHLSKLFDNMAKMEFQLDDSKEPTKISLGMYSKEEEYVAFSEPCDCSGQVEIWLNHVLTHMKATVRHEMTEGVMAYEEKPREQWLFDYPAQVALTCTQIWWTTEVGIAFARLEEGYENAMKDYYKKQVAQLKTLITMLIGQLSKGDRQKIMTICTIDVHARDVVAKMIAQKVDNAQAFLWLSQLRHRWDDEAKHCFANICDAQFLYSYEYLGNTPRLVITPLTDRCYITLTQSLHLTMSGAPAGPAGTGKTETTKDLGRALGIMVYVFNCSEQMDYKSCGNIYKGLAQSGAWGCFDEFNRISVEVLSVVAVQVKSIQDAVKDKKQRFSFLGEEISLNPSVGIFITMNPGYAGRTELPENLKALFRPCAMVVPDFELICEIMLVAEGFIEARLLARKFITLYQLCKELLSKQDHYDWGLRAIKSVLVVAGSLKRGDPDRPEDQVLMRSLRDFNIPKIVTDDMPVFLGLIGDLFPALDVPRRRDLNFEALVRKAVVDLKLQAEDNFVLKVVQLEELLAVRHSVFVVGGAGTGKSQVLRSLHKTYQIMKRRPVLTDLNPKVVTNDELFGIINPATREWKDGLFSSIMRELANITHDGPKWILLDGDIDPMWIESLNTVMDDNKVLTLASNERIPLNPTMRLLFEISHLRTATPATVSRAGILYINPADLGWNPPVSSWIDKREMQTERANLTILFDKYLPICLDTLRTRFKKIIPIPEHSMVQMLCHLLECLLTKEDIPMDCPKEIYELYFVFAAIWAFGGAMVQDQLVDYRTEFSKWWLTEFKTVKFPSQGTIFDYYIDPETKKFEPWSKLIPQFEFDPETPLQACLVHTSETIRVCYFMERLLARRRPVMLVGTAGTGKSVLVGAKLASLDPEEYLVKNVPFNYYTTSAMLQAVLEKSLEKKAGRNYAPPGNRKLIYFIDDMNMPEVDAYGTVQPHTIIRQHLDYGHWYDRNKLSLKEIMNVQYVTCMNPTAGSFTINPRLQRHFNVFVLSFPGADALSTIYSTILSQHLKHGNFPASLQKSVPQLINLALTFHQKIATTFLPTAIKFHYIFNLRDFASIFQGMLFSSVECVKSTQDLVKFYLHESNRVYRDKMVEEKDFDLFDKIQTEVVKKIFDDIEGSVEQTQNLNMYCHFANGIGDPKYMPVPSWELLSQTLVEALENHNEVNTVMDLVLFEDAMCHVCHINRILESPRGNALLVGVGGSGKQSLTRLAAFISSMDVFQITLRKGYHIPDFKVDLASLCLKAGVKNLSTVFLMTDAQVSDERFLVLINDLLATGEIPDLYSDDEVENIISNVRNEVKSQDLVDSRENCWKFFIDRVRRQLKVTLCFSPVGNKLRIRSRKFPAIVNCTAINWFHEWPQQALESVSLRFLQNTENIEPTVKQSISKFMAFVHTSVNQTSQSYLSNEQRYNYTTPKSFLEFIRLYQSLLRSNGKALRAKMERLENGLLKLHSTSAQVDDLKAKLATQEVELKQKNEDADKLIQVVGVETDKVSKEKAIADEEERKVALIMLEVKQKQKDCEEDLAKAEPALTAAQAALNTLNKTNLTELKSFGSPPSAVSNVSAAVMVLMAPGGKVPKDRSWKAAKVTMAKVDSFLDSLINFDKENIHENCLKAIRPYLQDPEFNPEFVATKSYAASGLCSWVINIVRFYEVFCDVEPKRQALSKATLDLTAAQEKLAAIKAKIAHLNENLAKLTAKFERATADKLKCQQEAEVTAGTISLANRLVGGLASENVRWAEAVQSFQQQERTLCGDVLLITAFISYLGFFTKKYRQSLMDGAWRPYLNQLKVPIPVTPSLDPLRMLTDEADVATWQNEGLPADRMSMENATVLINCERWPLMVDPQLQGIKWIKNKYGEALRVTQIGQKGYLQTIEHALEAGDMVLIENLEESIDPVLGPLLGREVIKKGRFIKIGDKECEYNPKFRLILHTKLANPHYQPELQAQATLINFTVTRDGLEDQLLAAVVSMERPDLEQLKSELTKQQNGFKITLKTLEDNLLSRLSSASGNFLGETALVENLEITKQTAAEVEKKVQEAKVTEVKINEAREHYRPAAARASLLYFIMNDLSRIHPMYQFSLKAFSVVFQKAVERAASSESLKERVTSLIDSITFSVCQYTTRGLFECDKLTYLAQLTFQILLMNQEVSAAELDFLFRSPAQAGLASPVEFLSDQAWGCIKALSFMEEFYNLDRDIEGSSKSWKKFMESECPEKEKFPQEWKNKTALQRLCMMRAMRPDRMTYAMRDFVEEKLGSKYVMGRALDFATSFEESGPATPMFFILSPGVDPLKDVENQGKKLGYTFNNRNFHNVSLGQGQEVVAEAALDLAAKKGHWVILQNIHLVAKWLSTLEKKLEEHSENSHPEFRVFISAEPSPSAASHIIPQGILENSIKITNEPPTGMHANLHKALDNFTQDTLEMCSREVEFKSILFALCYFHAAVAERRKFGPQGWNCSYPFNTGDLTISVNVLYNFLEANAKVPFDDLRYLFGEIMYGGHITDDWDRRLCRTYLEEFIKPKMLEGELHLAPGFPLPGNMDYNGYHQYIDAELPPESPYLYGLHPNAEIGFLTQTSEKLFRTVLELQPRDSHTGEGAGATREEKVKALLEEILERVTDEFNIPELMAKVEERTPYIVVALQECERMNILTREIQRSLRELDLGLKGELTMTSDMENLQNALFLDMVPEPWARRAYPSTAGLAAWVLDLLNRIKELEAWTGDFAMPSTVWLTGFFNPQSFLTAIMQSMARKNEWPLDQMALQCDVTKKNREEFRSPPREGAYVHGFFMEGARWDTQAGIITEAKLKELTPPMPVMFIKAIPVDKQDCRSVYPCPLYKTCQRGPTYVWTFNLKMKEAPSKWLLAGVALLLQI
ncbi:PREDICTED: LOW QUALITY PROTEIN: dynein heavy chain 9, axonemal [Elephantulus edwardii]|uniref:LOW QUALITY PROTEIN: dynein heavy chain 9, axonemal n=1 Tax=Elephantulus edwardii TaxID=28737 RepID=UPI0003F0C913|nr:PREDICTED: LOW QUALITY PROTEIN: dynein heavy chain 9, axonemal [Elephantulus edwardii]